MGYILKNTSGLINTRLTDIGRKKLSQGSFNISYFQIGDSEVSYNTLDDFYNQTNTNILEPQFNDQNNSGYPNSNKQYVKYPYFVDGTQGNTYGIPYMDSVVSPVYNRATMRGFFIGATSATPVNWSALTNNQYAINSNYVIDMSTLTGGSRITITYNACNTDILRIPQAGDFITIYYDGNGSSNCSCINLPTPGVTPTPSATPGVSPTPQPSLPPCDVTPTPTPSASVCPQPTPSAQCPPPEPVYCEMEMSSCYHILTYRIVQVCGSELVLDRPTPDFSIFNSSCVARAIIYPPTMTEIYDSITPSRHWNDDVINFESICGLDQFDVKIWNMNIPWSENPAGLIPTIYEGYSYFGSASYNGSKEYLGYMSNSGQTDSSSVYYYNSFDDKITLTPKEQKSIAIIHYTNQTIDLFYGEKFALEPTPVGDDEDVIGQARNFRVHIPWLMWHKASGCCDGQTFYVDPEGFEGLNLFQPYYLTSNKNDDMNNPGMRYFHLWDNNPNDDGYPSRVGKVFPDHKIIVIDDDEIIAAMSYKSNRNWTLPAPRVSFVAPNTCGSDNQSATGILTGDTQYLHVTYRFTNNSGFTNSLHCNYYSVIQGPNITCGPTISQNVGVRFGPEFNCLNCVPCSSSCAITDGYFAENIEIICQLVEGDGRPEPDEWKVLDVTSQISATSVNGCITQSGLTGTTFVITQEEYDNADYYNLNDYIPMVPLNSTGQTLNFGDEYYFYGNIETDIQATIYEMRYKINLSFNEFQASTNPSWSGGTSYITDIGLYDNEKNLMIISKMQSPVLRQGIQQFLVKFDF
jgi:hypothetical protein